MYERGRRTRAAPAPAHFESGHGGAPPARASGHDRDRHGTGLPFTSNRRLRAGAALTGTGNLMNELIEQARAIAAVLKARGHDVGNVAAFLLSDLAAGVSAEITYVDGGFSQVVGGIAD
ncbi:MAG: SDR family oxidoreductase [Burkholderiales bacterium]|nr:SDR family oxidoreductase [Burkholderiales bacterium]